MNRTFCQHCRIGIVNRPRGLCFRCYYTPDVRDLYPATDAKESGAMAHGATATETRPALTEAEILALPISFDDRGPAKREPLKQESKRCRDGTAKLGDTRAHWERVLPVELHPSTEPAAIAETQREVVRRAVLRVGSDPVAISAATDLPVWSVRRRLEELETGEA